MNSRRFATETAALCQACVLVGLVVTGLAGLGSAGIEKTGAAAIADHPPPSLAEEAELAYPPQVPSPETPPVQVATASSPDPLPDAKEAVSSVRILDECLVVDTCVDRYLWALYQRTPKEDSIKVPERRKVTVKKRGKMVTVTKSFTRLVDEDFAWKDPKAAEKAGMPMMDYVIGGMDRGFRLKLFHMLRAAEEAGLSPGITSAFRDATVKRSQAASRRPATGRITAEVCAAATVMALPPTLSASTAGHATSDGHRAKASGSGSMSTARSSALGDRILIEIRRMWHRSTVRNMRLTTAGRKLIMPLLT